MEKVMKKALHDLSRGQTHHIRAPPPSLEARKPMPE
jgi:hypothetical protein